MSRSADADDHRRIGELFERALDLPPEAREGFIRDACGGDGDLEAELRSLVGSHAAAPDFLDALAGRVLPNALDALEVEPPEGRVAGRYEILELVGRGGMGVVYKARDPVLGRLVALKFLPPHQADDAGALARLTAEARAASALDHPAIATVFEIGVAEVAPGGSGGRRPFIAMAFTAGETVADRIARGPVPVAEVVSWGAQIAEGLAAAHRAGIVHRDVKPANLLVADGGRVKILDFGVAKLSGVDLTREGARLGTVAYMSPEQASGRPVDPRTDLWSLGAVLYEALAGRRAFPGDADEVVLYGIRHDEPPPLATLRGDVPDALARLVRRCLAKDPDARPSGAHALLEELRALEEGRHVPPAGGERPGLVVLPFVNLSPDPDNEYVSDGLTEEVIARLSRIRALRVISRTSAMRLKGSPKDLGTLGRELGVRYALEGSVRKSGDALRISSQLVDTRSDATVWAEVFEGTVSEVLRSQERVATAIAGALRIELSPAEEREVGRRGIEDPAALDSYLRARHEMWSFSAEGLGRARRHVLNALEIVGENELLLATLGQIHVWFLQSGAAPDPDHLRRADACADAIFRVAPHSRHGHRLRGLVAFQRGDLRRARPHLQASLEANPDDPDALATLGYIHCLAGREVRGMPFFERLLVVDPLTPLNQALPGFVAALQGRFADAVEPYRTFLRMDDDGGFPLMNWIWVLGLNGRIDEAEPHVRRLEERHAGTPFAAVGRSLFHGLRGEAGAALQAISPALREAARHTEMFSRFLAECHAVAGDAAGALEWLESAVEKGLVHHPYLARIDPLLESVRGESGFRELMERVEAAWVAFDAPVAS